MTKKKFAVILCGCGSMDGSEIHEATFTLAAVDEHGADYQCYAPDRPQHRVMNFLTGEPDVTASRRQISEAARIARGQILPISQCHASDYDALLIPGGFGVAFNLCSFAVDGVNASVDAHVRGLLVDFHAQHKPIGAICISPVLLGLVLGQHRPIMTLGDLSDPSSQAMSSLGCQMQQCPATGYIHDSQNNIFSSPAYMVAKRIGEVRLGIYGLVESVCSSIR